MSTKIGSHRDGRRRAQRRGAPTRDDQQRSARAEKVDRTIRQAHGKEQAWKSVTRRGRAGLGWRGGCASWGWRATVVAPSLIPTRPGERVKTDKRDARKLARLLRAGELTAVYIPEATDEAIRDLCRARTDAVDDRRRARHRLKGFLLRHGYRYQGKSSWSAAHERYLRELVLPHPAMKVILEEYLQGIAAAGERIARCEAGMRDLLEQWRLAPAVRALMAMKGFQTVAAMILVSELGEVHRFAHPRQVMAYLGLVPTENTSSDKRRQGHITKCGNSHAALATGGVRATLRHPAQSIRAPEPAPGRSTQGGARDQLAGAEPLAPSLHPAARAPPPAQQGDGGDRARALRFYLGALAHPILLPGANLHLSDRVIRGEP